MRIGSIFVRQLLEFDMRPISLFTKLGTRLFFQSSVVRFFSFRGLTGQEGVISVNPAR
jgi:hypothetical protein